MTKRDTQPPVESASESQSEMDALLRHIATLEARLASQNKDPATSETVDQRNVELLRLAAETAHIIAWEWDPDKGRLRWGSNPERLLGPAANSDGDPGGEYPDLHELLDPKDYENFQAHAHACMSGGNGFVDSFRLRRTDGATRWILFRGEMVGRDAGNHSKLIGIALDIHERREAEIQSERLARQHRALLDNLPDLAWTKDLEGRYTAVNRAFAAYQARDPSAIIGKRHIDFLPPHAHEQVCAEDRTVIEHRKIVRSEHQYLNGSREGWMETVKAPILDRAGKVIGVVGLAHDLTARKQIENQLAESENRFRKFAELGPIGIGSRMRIIGWSN